MDAVTQYHAFPITPGLLTEAVELAERQALRAYDAVQLAGAVRLAAFAGAAAFVCSDRDLLAAAAAEGRAIDNPAGVP